MRKCVIIFIFLLSFSGAYCQSQIISNVLPENSLRIILSTSYQPGNNFLRRLDEGYEIGNKQRVYNSSDSSIGPSSSTFVPGVIITKVGDTLSGLIEYGYPAPPEKVIYRPVITATDSVFSIYNVKSIITQSFYYSNIPFNGKEKMMPWLAAGKINLYVYIKDYSYSKPDITFVLEKNKNQFVYINRKDFKVMMRHVFFDIPDMLEKIGIKGYRFDDMIKVIKEYNKRFESANNGGSQQK
jgi:hypothetical protein